MSKEEIISAFQEMEAKATKAPEDVEAALVRLDYLADYRRKDPAIEAEYETLRNKLAKLLGAEGPRYYLDLDGVKRYAYVVAPEPVEIDVAALIAMNKAGELSDEILEKIAPRKADKDAYRREATARRLTRKQIVDSSKVTKGTAHVRFSDPYDAS